MRDLFPNDWKPNIKRFLLGLDAWVDFSVFRSASGLRETYERFSTFMDRFHVSGWRRGLNELVSEGATLGTFGLVVMLALAIPAFRETSDDDWLKKSELAVTFLDRYGNEVASRGIKHNDAIPLDQFPDHLIKAVLSTEDRRFYEHFGIDIPGTARALVANTRAGGVVQGGSTITQQLAKNLFLNNERTIERKVKEAFLAMWLEARLTKNEILKLYLDRAYMGGGAFGVDAAAQYYFNKSARDVNLAEAAMLAGLFKAPSKFAPHINLPAARARANVVLDNLVEANMMTEGQVFGARRHPATPVDRRDDRAPNYYLDWAFDEMKKLVDSFPKTMTERVFVVRTALDTNLQANADAAIESSLRQYGQEYHARQAAAVLMDAGYGVDTNLRDGITDLGERGDIHSDSLGQVLRKGLHFQLGQTVNQHRVEVFHGGGCTGEDNGDVGADLLGERYHLEIHVDQRAFDPVLLFFADQRRVFLAVHFDRDQAGGGGAAQHDAGFFDNAGRTFDRHTNDGNQRSTSQPAINSPVPDLYANQGDKHSGENRDKAKQPGAGQAGVSGDSEESADKPRPSKGFFARMLGRSEK